MPDCGSNHSESSMPVEIPRYGTKEWNINLPRPSWLKVSLRTTPRYVNVKNALKSGKLNTVCQEARCPNQQECWTSGCATFIIMGDICTRSCAYCAVKSGHPLPLDPNEPKEVAIAVQSLNLKHAVITSVDRDDLPDFGSGHFVETLEQIRLLCPETTTEILTPDFMGNSEALEAVFAAKPTVFNHNTETVPRLYPRLRSKGVYTRCLDVLKSAHLYRKAHPSVKMLTKSGLMLGLSETRDEVLAVLRDLREVNVDILTLGQYLRPSMKHVPVMRYWEPEEFESLRQEALNMGFAFVEAGPLIRSSYRAKNHLDSLKGAI